jgi:hypothetical protein
VHCKGRPALVVGCIPRRCALRSTLAQLLLAAREAPLKLDVPLNKI